MDPAEVRRHLDKVLASSAFAGAFRLHQFLRFVVQMTLDGRTDEIKETVVAGQVFGRRSDFDPHNDSVVRVHATHLRKRLRDYYGRDGLRDGMMIEVPPGTYVPIFRVRDFPRAIAGRLRRRSLLLAALGVVGVAGALSIWLWLALERPITLAVLPFTYLDAAQSEYFADGISEDLMMSLARVPGLRVVARRSAFQFRGKNTSVRAVGRDLHASVLLEGSIRGDHDHLKITVQLVHAAHGFNLWLGSWEGPAVDVALFEEHVDRAVQRALGLSQGKRESTASASIVRPPSPSAQESYWRARYLLGKGRAGRAASVRFLEEAVRADPAYAPAYAGLATIYSTMAFHEEGDIDELVPKARGASERALRLDPSSAEALTSLAVLSYAFDHDWASAERSFDRALDINASYARGHLQYAVGLVTRARFDAAIAHIRAARVLDPLSFAVGNDLAVALGCAGRYDESIASARQLLLNDPTFAQAHVPLGVALAMKGDFTGATAELQQAIRILGRDPWILGPMGYSFARAGKTLDAANIIREITPAAGAAVEVAHVYSGLGDKARALDALERAYQRRIVDLNFMAVDPMLAGLRGEPRFLALKHRMSL